MAKITKERDDLKKEVSFIIIFFRKIEKHKKTIEKVEGLNEELSNVLEKFKAKEEKVSRIYFIYWKRYNRHTFIP